MPPCMRKTRFNGIDHVRTTVGLREDYFDFDVKDKMLNPDGSCNLTSDPEGCVTGNQHAMIFSPKVGIVLGPWNNTTFFIDAGDGYHSNDARGVTRSGQNPDVSPVTPLTRATGAESGSCHTYHSAVGNYIGCIPTEA